MVTAPGWVNPPAAAISWRDKSFGPAHIGRTVTDLVAAGLSADALPTPLLTLDAGSVEHNIATMGAYLAAHGVELAPHGKTTMAPQLWRRQIDAGAWAITVATPWQLRVAHAHGIATVMHAGAMLTPSDLRYVAGHLDEHPDRRVLVWVDSSESARLTSQGYPRGGRPLEVLVDRGGPGARTGARSLDEALATADTVTSAPNLALAGIAAWEGSLEGTSGPDGRRIVAAFCDGVADTFRAAVDAGLLHPAEHPVITGGGSTFFDIVVQRWASLAGIGARIVLRSGCYLTHDDGQYAETSPFRSDGGGALRPALHLWAQVVSRPEPGLALLNAGRRDAPYDGMLPVPQRVRGRSLEDSARALSGASISAVNDQHAYLRLSPGSDLRLGEVVRCGISHPCTAFDKWSLIPVLDDADAAVPAVIGAVRTYF